MRLARLRSRRVHVAADRGRSRALAAILFLCAANSTTAARVLAADTTPRTATASYVWSELRPVVAASGPAMARVVAASGPAESPPLAPETFASGADVVAAVFDPIAAGFDAVDDDVRASIARDRLARAVDAASAFRGIQAASLLASLGANAGVGVVGFDPSLLAYVLAVLGASDGVMTSPFG